MAVPPAFIHRRRPPDLDRPPGVSITQSPFARLRHRRTHQRHRRPDHHQSSPFGRRSPGSPAASTPTTGVGSAPPGGGPPVGISAGRLPRMAFTASPTHHHHHSPGFTSFRQRHWHCAFSIGIGIAFLRHHRIIHPGPPHHRHHHPSSPINISPSPPIGSFQIINHRPPHLSASLHRRRPTSPVVVYRRSFLSPPSSTYRPPIVASSSPIAHQHRRRHLHHRGVQPPGGNWHRFAVCIAFICLSCHPPSPAATTTTHVTTTFGWRAAAASNQFGNNLARQRHHHHH